MTNGTVTAKINYYADIAKTKPLYQYDSGQTLIITGVTLPDSYTVYFCPTCQGIATKVTGDANGVQIPDALLQQAGEIHAWLYLHTGENDGETRGHIVIPVIKRAGLP